MTFSWTRAPDLMSRLTTAQNHKANINQDIMTFAGMCDSREELERHVVGYETLALMHDAPKHMGKVYAMLAGAQ